MTRRRWLYTLGGVKLPEPVEVSDDWRPPAEGRAPVTDLYMDGVRATDGTDIGSRKKRREFMNVRGLADADDFKGEWAKAAEKRAAFFQGNSKDSSRREAIARAMHNRGRK